MKSFGPPRILNGRFPLLYVFLMVAFCVYVLGLLSYFGHDALHLLTAGFHSGFWDLFFTWGTNLGEIYFPILFFVLYLFKGNRADLLVFLLAFVIQWVVVQSIKQYFFDDGIRPVLYFERRNIDLPLVQGVSVNITRTFPSGHAAMGSLAFFLLAQCLRRWYWQLLCFGGALVAAISRVYLWKHFAIDTVAGVIIGLGAVGLAQQLGGRLWNSVDHSEVNH